MSKAAYNIVLIGAKSTGKTVYLTSLYFLPFIRITDKETLEYLKPLKEQFEKRDIPATNAGYQELFFEYKKGYFNLRFQIDDYDGKFAEQFSSKENEELKNKLEDNIKRAEGIMFFLPYEENLDMKKIENIREEIDLFIEKIKQIHPDKKDLPVPVVIAVTKWDNPSFFKQENEIEKAQEYIENNEILKNIKEKIETFFSNVTLIPISSYEKYNLEKPLEFCFSKTFETWEEIITNKKDKKDLLCFLKSILDDIQHYKDGKYKKLYEEIEKEVFEELINKFENIASLEEFEELEKKYKIKDKNIITCLLNEHIEKIEEIKSNLKELKKKYLIKRGLVAAIMVIVVGSGYYFYAQSKNKNILYTEIQTTYKAGNFAKSLSLIEKYKKKFSKDDKNYKFVIKIENDIYKNCKNNINAKIEKLNKINSLEKQSILFENIKQEAFVCKLASPDLDIYKKYNDYKELLNYINNLIIENIDDTISMEITNKLNEIDSYEEYNKVLKLLNQKLNSIAQVLIESTNESDMDNIQKLLNFISQLGIENEELISKLQDKYNNFKIYSEYLAFKDNLETLDYPEAIRYLNENYK